MKYKLFKGCLSVIFISCLFFYTGCIDECDGQEGEPTLYISFATEKRYTRVYGVGGKTTQPLLYLNPVPVTTPLLFAIAARLKWNLNDVASDFFSMTSKLQSQPPLRGFRMK
jgi:hypothetical protein